MYMLFMIILITSLIILDIVFIYSFVYSVVINPITHLIEILKGKLDLTHAQKESLEKLDDNVRYINEVLHL